MSGTIFSVNDVSGIPSIEVEDDGTIYLAESTGNVLIGTGTDDGSTKLQVNGSIKVEDGTLSLPSYSFISDPDSGMTSIASNAIGFHYWRQRSALKLILMACLLTGTSSLYMSMVKKQSLTLVLYKMFNSKEQLQALVLIQVSIFTILLIFQDSSLLHNGNVSHSKWRTGGTGGKHIFENGSGTERAEIDASGNFSSRWKHNCLWFCLRY